MPGFEIIEDIEALKVTTDDMLTELDNAKGTEIDLATRLSKSDNLNNTMLSDMANKANQLYVDTKFGNMGNAKTFKGSCLFANLPVSGMIVDDYWYATDQTTNYCYNGTSWFDIGANGNVGVNTISNEKIMDNQVYLEKLGIVEEATHQNLYNPIYKEANNTCVNVNTGALYTVSGYYATGKIKIKSGLTDVYSADGEIIAFYKADDTWISSARKATNFTFLRSGVGNAYGIYKIPVPIDTSYARVNYANAYLYPMLSSSDFTTYVPFVDNYSSLTLKNTQKQLLLSALGLSNWFVGKKVNFLGDSITWGYTPNTGVLMLRPFPVKVQELLGLATIRNYGISHSKISTTELKDPFCTRYVDMDNDADVICVFGGTNDYEGSTNWGSPLGVVTDTDPLTFYGAMNILTDGLITKYPKSIIFFATPLHRIGDDLANKRGVFLSQYVNVMRMACEVRGIPVLDLFSMGNFDPKNVAQKTAYSADGLHPSQEFHENVLSRKFASFMKTII